MKKISAILLGSLLLSTTASVFADKNTFNGSFKLHGIQFKVISQDKHLRIIPSGLAIDNSPIERDIEGVVTGASIGDINVDGSPEIYIYSKDKDKGSLIAYSANNKKSLGEIYLPPITDDPKLTKGYRGHDDFMMVEGIIAQRFPIYKDNDSNTKPTGGWRQLQYKLTKGEAGWVLKLDKVLEF
ncbi:MAG: hypothetical protein NTV43_01125 [Methylococcales bacterium]|nr:hypothetical protein [Methylococcales bacterium]